MPRQEPETIKVTKAVFHSSHGEWKTCDVIENNGRRWLVARWMLKAGSRMSWPERVVLMEGLESQYIGPAGSDMPVDWLIVTPIPELIFDVKTPVAGPFYVVDEPNIPVRRTA